MCDICKIVGRIGLAGALLIPFCNFAFADSKSVSWPDANYVVCEGLGATASGKITANAEFTSENGTLKVTKFQLHTEYQHPHDPNATLRFQQPNGRDGSVVMQKAWFHTIGPDDGSKDLYLPRSGNRAGPAAQTPFEIAAGTGIEVSVNTVFPQDGGNCVSSFSDTLQLP